MNKWFRFIKRLTDLDEWLHKHASWLDSIPTRVAFCQWTWAEWAVWTKWMEGKKDKDSLDKEVYYG